MNFADELKASNSNLRCLQQQELEEREFMSRIEYLIKQQCRRSKENHIYGYFSMDDGGYYVLSSNPRGWHSSHSYKLLIENVIKNLGFTDYCVELREMPDRSDRNFSIFNRTTKICMYMSIKW